MSIPSNAASILWKGRFYIVYVNADGTISGMIGPEAGQVEDAKNNPPYQLGSIKMDGKPVKASTTEPAIAAVSYTTKTGTEQIRVYYQNADNELCEMCFNEGQSDWFRGSLTSLEIKVWPKSLLTACVDDTWLKVYYQAKENQMNVSWVVRGEESWSKRPIGTKF